MKNLATIFILVLSLVFSANAQDGAYQKAMGKAMGEMQAAQTPDAMLATANTFERISQKASEEYLPYYYAAFNLLNYNWSMQNAKERDEVIDRALGIVKKAQEVSPGNDELEVLYGYALMAKMTVDPMNRAQTYSPQINQSFSKAMAMNPNNPRAMIMMGRMELGTAQYMGTEPTKACELANRGMTALEAEGKREGFEPSWGKESAQEVLAACSKN